MSALRTLHAAPIRTSPSTSSFLRSIVSISSRQQQLSYSSSASFSTSLTNKSTRPCSSSSSSTFIQSQILPRPRGQVQLRTMATADHQKRNATEMATISDAIIKDHRELEEYYNEVINNEGNKDHQERYGNQFVWELARHSVGEELVVYPAMEKYLGAKGKEMAESDRKEHHQVKELLKMFQNMKPSSPDYITTLKDLWAVLSHHIKDEESQDLPTLESALKELTTSSGNDESQAMAKSFGRTKAFVPSRSHPSAGEHPPFETAMGLLTAPIDHVADLFRKFPQGKITPNPSTK